MSAPDKIAEKRLEDFEHLIRSPENRVRQLIQKITHSGETDLNNDDVGELKNICKVSKDELMVFVYRECMKHLHKHHSQVRVAAVKLLDYLFQRSHILREKLLDEFDVFLELTLAITQRPKVQLKLPPPKKYSALLEELGTKTIYKWHADFGEGYEKLRYAYRFLREHGLVDFNRFQVNTRERLIKQQKAAEHQEKILTRAIENRLKEFKELKPQLEQLLAQIGSLIDILVPIDESLLCLPGSASRSTDLRREVEMQQHGFANLSQNIDIEFGPFVEVKKDGNNKEIVRTLKELKKELIDGKLTKLISIEKVINKRSEEMVQTLKEIIDLKNKSMNVVLKLGELKIVAQEPDKLNEGLKSTLDEASSDTDGDDFDEVPLKDDLESYIPKSLRFDYGLEPIEPRELVAQSRISLTDDSFFGEPSTSGSDASFVARTCNVLTESGKLCPRRDKIKCPFHGKIIPRDHLGVPLDEKDRLDEERRNQKKVSKVPEWQDPQLLAEIKAATGVDLTMPTRGRSGRIKKGPNNNLANPKTCDITPKQRLQKKLKSIK